MEDIPEETREMVYEELGEQHDKLLEVIELYEDLDLEHIESYEMITERAARYRQMRGRLKANNKLE